MSANLSNHSSTTYFHEPVDHYCSMVGGDVSSSVLKIVTKGWMPLLSLLQVEEDGFFVVTALLQGQQIAVVRGGFAEALSSSCSGGFRTQDPNNASRVPKGVSFSSERACNA